MADSPAFYFKELYIGAERWTVPRVLAKLRYRDDGIDTVNTKALERHLSSLPDLYALEGLRVYLFKSSSDR